MASVIGSGRDSAIGVFDMITTTTGLVTSTLDSASKGLDIIHAKVRVAHASATSNLDEQIKLATNRNRRTLAESHGEFLVDQDERLEKNPALAVKFAAILAQLEADAE